jgi:hypothetical protein
VQMTELSHERPRASPFREVAARVASMPMTAMVAACVLLAAISLIGPDQPSFDPYSWLIWGREIAHLTLDTTSGPSWKPLPVMFTTLFAPLSAIDDHIPPALWLVVVRAGGLLALALAVKLAARIVGGSAPRQAVAGAVAAVTLLLTPQWLLYMIQGSEAVLSVALILWAVDLHLDRRRNWAFVLGALVCLARPELFGFLVLYGLYLWWRNPPSWKFVGAVFVVIPLAWLVPSWYGSGNPLAAGEQAHSEPSWSLSLVADPWRAALDVAQHQTWPVLEVTAGVAVLLALLGARGARFGLPRPARPGTVVVVAAFGAVMIAMFAAMTQGGFTGNPRYVLPGVAAISVAGGVGVALIMDVVGRVGAALAGRVAARPAWGAAAGSLVALALIVGLAAPEIREHRRTVRNQTDLALKLSRLNAQLSDAVDAVGASYVTRFGPATVNRAAQTHLAWELGVPISYVHGTLGRGIVFRAPVMPVAGVLRISPRARQRVVLARVGQWTVSTRPPYAQHVYTWPIEGFNLRRAAARYASTASTQLD